MCGGGWGGGGGLTFAAELNSLSQLNRLLTPFRDCPEKVHKAVAVITAEADDVDSGRPVIGYALVTNVRILTAAATDSHFFRSYLALSKVPTTTTSPGTFKSTRCTSRTARRTSED